MSSNHSASDMNYSKLAELRAKTDRQLITVIARRLDAGIDHARRGLQTQARSAHREVRTLLPLVNGITMIEKRRLESKLTRLENVMQESAAGMRIQTACS